MPADQPCSATSRRALLLVGACWLVPPAGAQPAGDRLQVRVDRVGDRVIVDVSVRVDAPLADAWATLTDYDHMAGFVDNLKSSAIVRRQGDRLEVAQSGETRVALMSFAFTTVRAVELKPMHEIRSQLISGDFKTFESVTRLSEVGGETLISYHGEFVPTAWLPPLIGPGIIRDETRKQYGQLVAEILRRRGPVAKAPAARASAAP